MYHLRQECVEPKYEFPVPAEKRFDLLYDALSVDPAWPAASALARHIGMPDAIGHSGCREKLTSEL